MFPGTPKAVPNAIFVLVEFKRGRVMQFQCPFIIQPGEYVMVDGDDGTDMGMVIDSWVAHADSPPRVNNSQNSNRLSLLSNLDPVTGTPTRFPTYPKVMRRATQDEVAYLHGPLAAAEKKCTEIARRKARDLGLPMSILDAEYQFDCRKLTFYFDSRERVEFQRLLHELFAIYHVRIWMATVRPRVPYGPPKVQSPAQAQGQHQPQAQYQVPAVH
jgi:cell fate regulator YaaT (PSP1 superfamily)